MSKVISPVVEGIKDSFRLSAGIVLAVGSVLSSFAHHSLSLRDVGIKDMPPQNRPPHDPTDRRATAR
jgi:hypothetical protein